MNYHVGQIIYRSFLPVVYDVDLSGKIDQMDHIYTYIPDMSV